MALLFSTICRLRLRRQHFFQGHTDISGRFQRKHLQLTNPRHNVSAQLRVSWRTLCVCLYNYVVKCLQLNTNTNTEHCILLLKPFKSNQQIFRGEFSVVSRQWCKQPVLRSRGHQELRIISLFVLWKPLMREKYSMHVIRGLLSGQPRAVSSWGFISQCYFSISCLLHQVGPG